jgi:GGDEF domain-containing protein
MATSFSGGRSQSTLREPPIMGKQLDIDINDFKKFNHEWKMLIGASVIFSFADRLSAV